MGTKYKGMTLKCDANLELLVLHTESNFWVKFNENRSKGSGDMERTPIEGKIAWPGSVTLTLSLHSRRVICSAHRVTERNIWVKLNGNRSKGSEDMEWTQNSRVKPLTLTCDLDLASGSWITERKM